MRLDHGADVSVVEAGKTDARRLKRLKNEAERMKQHLKFEMGSAQKANKQNIHQLSLLFKGQKNSQSLYLKSKKVLRQTPS